MGRPCQCCSRVVGLDQYAGAYADILFEPSLEEFATIEYPTPLQVDKTHNAYFLPTTGFGYSYPLDLSSAYNYPVSHAEHLLEWLNGGKRRLCVLIDYRHLYDIDGVTIQQTIFNDARYAACNLFLETLGSTIRVSPKDYVENGLDGIGSADPVGSAGLVAGLTEIYTAAYGTTSGGTTILESSLDTRVPAGNEPVGAIEAIGEGLLMVLADTNILYGDYGNVGPAVDYDDMAELLRRFCVEPIGSLL